jgi:heme-degrading monooxygenase HmoA
MMTDTPTAYTTGSWQPDPGHEDAFLDAWQDFANWSCQMPGAHLAVLARDLRDPNRFVSLMAWDTLEDIRAWKRSPEFKPHMAHVQEHIDRFAPTELDVVATAVHEYARDTV